MKTTTGKLYKNFDLLELAETMVEIRDSMTALEMMTDAYLLGPEDYNEERAAEAMHMIIEMARGKADAAEQRIKSILNNAVTA